MHFLGALEERTAREHAAALHTKPWQQSGALVANLPGSCTHLHYHDPFLYSEYELSIVALNPVIRRVERCKLINARVRCAHQCVGYKPVNTGLQTYLSKLGSLVRSTRHRAHIIRVTSAYTIREARRRTCRHEIRDPREASRNVERRDINNKDIRS